MYRRLGKFGNVNIRPIRYYEDILQDKTYKYRFGFDINLLPVLKVCNCYMRVSVKVAWLLWEVLWFRYKDVRIETDIQGNTREIHHGIRYFLSLRWLWG